MQNFQPWLTALDGNTARLLETQRQQIQANSRGIQKLITDTTITKEDGATVSVKEQLNQTVEDVSGVRQSIHSLETNYNKVTGDLSSLESKQAEYTKTLDEFGVEFTTIKKDTDTIAKQVDELSSMTDTIELYGENVFITEGGVTKPSAITLTARPRNRAVIATWLLDNTVITSGISPDRTQLTLPFSALNGKKSVVIKAQNADGSIYDILTVYSVSDGKDAVSVVLTSDKGNIFRQGELTDTTITCRVYEGAQEIDGVKSYEWFTSADNGTTWTKIANASTKSIPLALNDIVTNKLIKCKVDI